MRLPSEKVKKIAKNKGMDLRTLLTRAGVSKTAYYHLTRQESLLPKSLLFLAKALDVSPAQLVEFESPEMVKIRRLRKVQGRILSRYPSADPENIWHTLLLLEKSPWERLERGLLRAQNQNFYR